jgi:glycosyltransferase A (GT-A) superfamily protein (DUF2064 family)
VRPALLLVAGDLQAGVPGLTEDPAAADALLGAALDVARATGGVGRVLLFSPPEAEASLTARALGFRLWPADGDTDGVRWANAFRQAGELGYEGAVVVGLGAAGISAARLTEVVDLLVTHAGVVIPDDRGAIAVLGLQRPEPTLLPPGPEVPDVDTLRTRARQLRIAVHELPPHPAISADDLPGFLAAGD